jgi:hypothetical protein
VALASVVRGLADRGLADQASPAEASAARVPASEVPAAPVDLAPASEAPARAARVGRFIPPQRHPLAANRARAHAEHAASDGFAGSFTRAISAILKRGPQHCGRWQPSPSHA